MEDTDEFAWAVKVVIKRQMRDLMEQLRERGEEVAVMTVNVEDNTCSHFGSPNGEWFISEQKNITKSFLDFCQTNGSGKKKGKQAAGTQKKKSIASLKDSSKQSASNEVPEVRVTVPKNLVGDMTEEEVANLVGRIVATHLAVQEKGDGSSSGTQFDVLVRTANHSKKDTSVPSTPTRSARKRKPTAKYMEGMSTLKKSKRLDDDDAASELGTEDDTNIISLLSELNNTVLRKVQVSINNERNINLEDYDIEASENTEWLAVNIIHELDAISGGQLAHKKSIKLTVVLRGRKLNIDIKAGKDHYTAVRDEDIIIETVHEGFDQFVNDTVGNDDSVNDTVGNDDSEGYDEMEDGDSDMEDLETADVNWLPENEYSKSEDKTVKEKGKSKPYVKPSPGTNRYYSKIAPFPCDICGKIYVGKYNLEAHVRRVHFRERNYKCTICKKSFFTNADVDAHMLCIHTKRCQECEEYVLESEPWSDGTNIQSERVVVCQCGSPVTFVTHFTGRKRYNKQNEVLKAEEDGTTRYVCEHCGKAFKRKSHCVRHMKIHTEKDVKCQCCSLSFNDKKSLKEHLAENHNEPTHEHVCKHCSEAFSTVEELKSHMETDCERAHSPEVTGQRQEGKPQTVFVVQNSSSSTKTSRAAPSVSTVANEQSEAYSLQLVQNVLQDFPEYAGEGTSIIIKHVEL